MITKRIFARLAIATAATLVGEHGCTGERRAENKRDSQLAQAADGE